MRKQILLSSQAHGLWHDMSHMKRDAEPGLSSLDVTSWDEHNLPCHLTQPVCATLFRSCCSHPKAAATFWLLVTPVKAKSWASFLADKAQPARNVAADVLTHHPKPPRAAGLEEFPSLCGPRKTQPPHRGFPLTAMPSSQVSQEAAHTRRGFTRKPDGH